MSVRIVNGEKVRTDNVCPPVPSRDMDWSAVLDNYYDGAPDTGYGRCSLVGWGASEQAAIDDLMEQLEELDE